MTRHHLAVVVARWVLHSAIWRMVWLLPVPAVLFVGFVAVVYLARRRYSPTREW
jgi:hypothetical protein